MTSIEPFKGANDVNYMGVRRRMMVTTPLQLVHLDFMSFEVMTDLNETPKVKHVLVIMDHFMRYTRAYVTKDQKALTAA